MKRLTNNFAVASRKQFQTNLEKVDGSFQNVSGIRYIVKIGCDLIFVTINLCFLNS